MSCSRKTSSQVKCPAECVQVFSTEILKFAEKDSTCMCWLCTQVSSAESSEPHLSRSDIRHGPPSDHL